MIRYIIRINKCDTVTPICINQSSQEKQKREQFL